MDFKYFPQTEQDIALMLERIGVNSLEDLYAEVPESVRFKGEFKLPSAKSELELRDCFRKLGNKNLQLTCFAGAGAYDKYTPSVVQNIVQRSEFLTSYTPYQAEVAQGTLHYIFEFQSMIAELTGMDISNACMYDGATSTAEAVVMAYESVKKAEKVLVSATIDPKVLAVVKTLAKFHHIQIEMVPEENGVTNRAVMQQKLKEGGVAGMVVQQPNYYGIIENYDGFADDCHENKALFIMNCIAADLSLLKTPGELDADIAVGEGQSLGIPLSFGGAYIGYFCCKEKLMRKMPGRIVGKTVDENGQRAFVLTLQAREQHIRRQKATSNICSNQSLLALFTTVYMSIMGKEGMKEAAQRSYDGAHYLCDQLVKTGRFSLAYQQPFFNEFVVKYDGDVDTFQQRCIENGILGGVKIGDDKIMFAVTEKRTKEEIDQLVNIAKL